MIWTVGHGRATSEELADLLVGVGITAVVDVRRYPGSRRHPHFGRDEMAGWLADRGIAHGWSPGLGGRRRPAPDSPNVALRNEQFRAYADHMASAEFADAVEALRRTAAASRVAVMCAETVWWRCHRRLLADHLVLVEGIEVEHVFHDGRRATHPVTPGARRQGDYVTYDALDG